MTSMKKTLAIICALIVMAVAVVIPLSAFTGSTMTMPETFTLIEDFETGSDGWQSVGSAVFATSEDYGYGTSGSSLKVELATGWKGAKIQSCAHAIVNDGLAFWIYLPQSVASGKTFAINIRVGTAWGDQVTKYEAKVPVSDLTAGEHIITIPWSDFVLKSGSVALAAGNYITQVEFTSNAGSGIYYLDQFGMYKDQGTQSTFIPSTVDMPDNYKVIDDFNKDSNLSWQSTNKASLALSADRGYGEAGKSAHVSWNEAGWSGFKTSSNQSLTMNGDGLAFWVYNAGAKITDLVVVLNCNGTKFEKKVTFEQGEQVFTIPWAEFVNKNAGAFDVSKTISQIEFTKSVAAAEFYVDELACYVAEVACTHANTKEIVTKEATYFTTGLKNIVCADEACGAIVEEGVVISCDKANPVIFEEPVLNPATNQLKVEWEYSDALATDLLNATTKELVVKFAFGDKEYSVKLDDVENLGQVLFIEGINATRFAQNFSVSLEFVVDAYDTTVLNAAAKSLAVKVSDSIDASNEKADEYASLIEEIGKVEEAVVVGEGADNTDFKAGASKVDIANGKVEFKLVATDALIKELQGNKAYNDGRTVTLVITVGDESHEIELAKLMSNITVKISGLSFDQMYGKISAKLVIDYAEIEDITTEVVEFDFANSINNSNNAVAKALKALLG